MKFQVLTVVCMTIAMLWVVNAVDGGSRHLRNVGKHLPDNVAQHPTRQPVSNESAAKETKNTVTMEGHEDAKWFELLHSGQMRDEEMIKMSELGGMSWRETFLMRCVSLLWPTSREELTSSTLTLLSATLGMHFQILNEIVGCRSTETSLLQVLG
jgi:hypothetical protein